MKQAGMSDVRTSVLVRSGCGASSLEQYGRYRRKC